MQFTKNAPQSARGRRAFAKGTFYIRREISARPADDTDDFVFLFKGEGRELSGLEHVGATTLLEHNLPARDPGMIDFVGRSSVIDSLTRWFADQFSNFILLVGIGGIGKTAIARSFSELLVQTNPVAYEKIDLVDSENPILCLPRGKLRA